jgi:hypothetical protein
MSRLEKLKNKFLRVTTPKDISWDELVRVLGSLGYEPIEGSGSRVKFVSQHRPDLPYINLHKRHPDSTLLPYQVRIVRRLLEEQE